ncbi:MAG: hypothetical protein V7641_2583, partial [Blastocatellia bacterium]
MSTFRPDGAWLLFDACNYKHCVPNGTQNRLLLLAFYLLFKNFLRLIIRMTIVEGDMSRIIPRPTEMRNPGVGQIYNGKILRGLFWLIVTPGIWLGTGGWFGWVCHLVAAY